MNSYFKEITASTSERREYTDKPLDYYEAFMIVLVISVSS